MVTVLAIVIVAGGLVGYFVYRGAITIQEFNNHPEAPVSPTEGPVAAFCRAAESQEICVGPNALVNLLEWPNLLALCEEAKVFCSEVKKSSSRRTSFGNGILSTAKAVDVETPRVRCTPLSFEETAHAYPYLVIAEAVKEVPAPSSETNYYKVWEVRPIEVLKGGSFPQKIVVIETFSAEQAFFQAGSKYLLFLTNDKVDLSRYNLLLTGHFLTDSVGCAIYSRNIDAKPLTLEERRIIEVAVAAGMPRVKPQCQQVSLFAAKSEVGAALVGEAIEPHDEIAETMLKEKLEAGVPGKSWKIKPTELFKIDSLFEEITVWTPHLDFQKGKQYLFFLDRNPYFGGSNYLTVSTDCNLGSRSLTERPLTASESQELGSLASPGIVQARLKPLCANAEELARRFEKGEFPGTPREVSSSRKGEFSETPRNTIQTLELASKVCGFHWCNPQYCH